MDILFSLLAAYGICFALQQKLPFLYGKSSFLDAMLQCTFCTGFHCGWMTWLLSWGVSGRLPAEGWHIPFSLLLWSFASAVTCYTLDALTNWLEASAAKGVK